MEALNPIPVLHRDAHILVVRKPGGLLTIPGRTPDKSDCLWTRLRNQLPGEDVRLVHRLDRDTAGLMLFALSKPAQAALGRQFERREVQKRYFATVTGQLNPPTGVIRAPLRKDWTRNDPPVYVVDPEKGKSAETHWETVSRTETETGVVLKPVTGRSHQLRVHMAHLGHPIVGDPIYGTPDPARGLQLTAVFLAFTHPGTGEQVQFTLT